MFRAPANFLSNLIKRLHLASLRPQLIESTSRRDKETMIRRVNFIIMLSRGPSNKMIAYQ